MEVQKILRESGYTGKIIYNSNYFEIAPSKRYTLIIEKDGKEFINRSHLTGSGAETLFYRWVAKQQ